LPLRKTARGVVLQVRVTPKAATARLNGFGEDAGGRRFLKVHVTEAPDKGKANEAVIRLLAKSLRLPKSAFEIVAGASERNKVVAIAGEPERLAQALGATLGGAVKPE
jgi:uncharacterized protein (TIGR00251 family)